PAELPADEHRLRPPPRAAGPDSRQGAQAPGPLAPGPRRARALPRPPVRDRHARADAARGDLGLGWHGRGRGRVPPLPGPREERLAPHGPRLRRRPRAVPPTPPGRARSRARAE